MKLNYIKYLWSKTNKIIIVATIITITIFFLSIYNQSPRTYFDDDKGYYISSYLPYHLNLGFLTIFVIIACFIVPIIIRRQILTTQKCDILLSLPIKRTKIVILSSIYGFIAIISVFTISLVIGIITYYAKGMDITIWYLLYYYLIMSLLGLFIFIISSMLYSFANNILDCILLLIITSLLILIVPYILNDIIYMNLNINTNSFNNGLFISISNFTTYIQTKTLTINKEYYIEYPFYYINDSFNKEYIDFLIYFLISIPSAFILYKNIVTYKAYHAGGLSNPKFCFNILIPILFFCILSLSEYDNILFISIFSIIYFISFFIVYREIKFTKYLIISFIVTLIIAIIINPYHQYAFVVCVDVVTDSLIS